MADNIAVTAGTGTTVATDDIAGAHYQRVKACWGVDGSANDTSATNPMPVTLTNLEKAEDAAHASGNSGIMALGVCTTDFDGSSATDEDYVALRLNAVGSLLVQDRPNTGGGLTPFQNIDVDESEDAIKASAGQLYALYIFNASAGVRYVKLYDDTVAGTIVGTTVPVATIGVKAGESTVLQWDKGLAFATGITIAATTAAAVADTGAPGANDVVVSGAYK